MKPNTFLKVLCALVLSLTLLVTSVPTTIFALQIYPVDYTFTGIGIPGTNAVVSVIDDKDVRVDFSAKVNTDGLYTIPAKIATATGQISTEVETKEGLEVSIYFYDITTLDTVVGGMIEAAIYEGEDAIPNSNVKVTFPDGSSSVVKTDTTGKFKALAPNTQEGGLVTIANLDGLGIEIGTPKEGNYKGGIEVVETTQITKIKADTVSSNKTPVTKIEEKPIINIPDEVKQNVAPTTTTTIATTAPTTSATVNTPSKVATVRTGGEVNYTLAVFVSLIAASFCAFKNKKTVQ